MSLKFVVELKGKRQTVSVTPMSPLLKIVEDVCFQQRLQLDVSACRLYYQKKLLDPTTPVRFANLPKEAKLELVTDEPEQRLGLADKPKASQSAATPPNVPATEAPADLQPALPAAMVMPMDITQSTCSEPAAVPSGQQPSAPTNGSQTLDSSRTSVRLNTASRGASSQAQAASTDAELPSSSSTSDAAAVSSTDKGPVPDGLDRPVRIFTREAAAAAEASSRDDTDLPAEFYDFTPDDLHKVMSGWAKKNSQAAGPLKTQKLRDQDERRRAEQFGPVPVRIHFPDNSIVQAEFKPLEPLSALQKLVQQCVQPNLPSWYMYVTPPKQVLKDLSLTFYKAGLLPAANVLIGTDGLHEGSFLKPHVAALQAPPPARSIAKSELGSTETRKSSAGNVGNGTQFLPSSRASASGEKKVPKWMKLGK